jgi:ubiquinone/menaquinone biosynthesis C-methylase UbiE
MNERPICSYEGSRYSTEFWTQARGYEDAVERIALRALLPPRGRRLLEIGAGFGRVVDLYQGYETIVLLDYAETQLAQAVERLGDDGPYVFVQANFYHLPFARGLFDAVTMIRTLHHATDAPAVLSEVSDVLGPEGAFVLEFANKQNLKAIARYLVGRQDWSPFERNPVEFVELNFDFHPRWIWAQLAHVGLEREAVRTVSHFRIQLLKRFLPTRLLASLDALVQPTGARWQLSPSVFVRSRAAAEKDPAPEGVFFRCPACGRPLEGLPPVASLSCACGETWTRNGAIYDFRWPR